MNRLGKAAKVDYIADTLVRKFDAPKSRNFFCKCGWLLNENTIWTIYEQAHGPKVRSPLKYFIAMCSFEMDKSSKGVKGE